MSVFYNNALIGASGQAAGGYKIERSLRFNSADSANLSRVFPSIATNQKVTLSVWAKRSGLGTDQSILSTNRSNTTNVDFIASNALRIYTGNGAGVGSFDWTTTQVFRDCSAWYNIVVAWDTTDATATNRLKVYINGQQITTWSVQQTITQNMQLGFSAATVLIGNGIASGYLNGYLTDVHFIDGQALTPSSFGEFDTNNIWQPKAYSGTYGTNGFHLDFADNSNNTATTLGKDTSGNSNNWTPNNLSVTAGAGNDSLVDSPTNYGTDTGAGGEVKGNYATLNPLGLGGGTLSNGNLSVSTSTDTATVSAFAMTTGKWYWEVTLTTSSNPRIGVYNVGAAAPAGLGATANGWCLINGPSRVFNNGSTTNYGTFSGNNGDVVMLAYDADAGKLWYGVNGSWFASGNPATGANPSQSSVTGSAIVPASSSGTGANVHDFNFGQRPFAYTAPSGFKALCTANLPTPTITKPSTVMDVVLYTGTGSTLTPTSTLGFSPDLVWIKSRSAATNHALYDAVRGAQARLESNTTDAEATSDNGLTAFNSNGFTLGTLAQVNTNAATYAGWCWDAGSSTVTNTAGSISSQVRANASAGCSVVTFTGTGANATIGHGLGVAPQMVIVKRRNTTGDWAVWHTSIAATNYLLLNSNAASASGATYWNSTSPTSTVFSVGTAANTNANTGTYVSYCFAPVAGYSAFGSYTGNGSTDGPYIHLGFRPAFVIIKCSSASGTSFMSKDYKRAADYNPASGNLYLDATNTEDTINTVDMDFLANGIKLRGTYSGINSSSNTYIYAAWAQYPFALARAR